MMDFLPHLIFYFLILIFLVLFLWLIKILFYTEGTNLSIKQKIITLCLIIAIGVAFSLLVSFLLEKGDLMRPFEISEIKKPYSTVDFPPSPSFIEIGDYYFSGPRTIETSYNKSPISFWIVLCKDDIIGVGSFSSNKLSFNQEEKECFLDKCSEPYYATLPFFSEEETEELERVAHYVINKYNPHCNFYE